MSDKPARTGPCTTSDSFHDFPWWGMTEGDTNLPPPKGELFAQSDYEHPFHCYMMMEDFLQHNGVFVNGISGRRAHSDSYMTCVDFAAFDRCMELLEEAYHPAPEDWRMVVTYWLTNPNMQPPLRLVAIELDSQHKLGIYEPTTK